MTRALRIDGWAKQFFQCLDVFGKGLATGFGDSIEGLRLAQHEFLFSVGRHQSGEGEDDANWVA